MISFSSFQCLSVLGDEGCTASSKHPRGPLQTQQAMNYPIQPVAFPGPIISPTRKDSGVRWSTLSLSIRLQPDTEEDQTAVISEEGATGVNGWMDG